MDIEKIFCKGKIFGILASLGYTPSESLLILIFLAYLDGFNCLSITEKEVADLAGTSYRTVNRLMVKLVEAKEVTKIGHRYSFVKLLETVEYFKNLFDKQR